MKWFSYGFGFIAIACLWRAAYEFWQIKVDEQDRPAILVVVAIFALVADVWLRAL